MHKSRAFSLPELLIVIAILGVLIGILMPVVAKARTASKRVACRAQLADIGRLFQMYLNDSKNRLPHVNPIPSLTALHGIPITELLERYTRNIRTGWKCPADRITQKIPGTIDGFETYFEREGLSYFYNPRLAFDFAGKQLNDHPFYRMGKQNMLAVFYEFDNFHGPENTLGSMNYLFADMHVGDLANE